MYRYTEQFRLSVIKEYLTGHAGAGALAKRYGIDEGTVRRWVAAYRLHGQASLKRRYKTYSAEFKLSVLERMRRQGLSHREVAALFDIRGSGAIGVWERQYDAGGLEALTPRPRGRRPSKMPQRTPKTKPSRSSGDLTRTREELLEELDYLRMENAYLKKLDALVQASKTSAQPKKRK